MSTLRSKSQQNLIKSLRDIRKRMRKTIRPAA
jgi:hypothetical protein